MRELNELTDSILELNDAEALRTANYVAEWMLEQLKERQLLPPELLGVTDDQAADLLTQAFPDLTQPLQQTRFGASESERGKIARNLLLLLAKDPGYAAKVDEAISQLSYKFEPLTTMAVASLLVFVLSIKFDVKYDRKNGFRMHVSKEATSKETLHEILTMGAGPGAAASAAS